jgi:hypothetical protein
MYLPYVHTVTPQMLPPFTNGMSVDVNKRVIERFIENQAFSPSYDLAPPPPLPSAKYLSFSVFLCVAGRGGGA